MHLIFFVGKMREAFGIVLDSNIHPLPFHSPLPLQPLSSNCRNTVLYLQLMTLVWIDTNVARTVKKADDASGKETLVWQEVLESLATLVWTDSSVARSVKKAC